MPAILTHDFFGRDAFEGVARATGITTQDERDAFLLGCQGPDPLFYLVVDPLMACWAPLGGRMHHERTPELLRSLAAGAERLHERERRVGRAFVAGFCCHWLLDSAEHPLVYHWQYGLCGAGVPGLGDADGPKVHAEVERDLDEAVLFRRTGQTIWAYRPAEHVLRARPAVLAALDKVVFYAALWTYDTTVDAHLYSAAVRSFRVVQRLLYSATGTRREVLGTVERVATHSPYSLYCALSHRVRHAATSEFDNRAREPWRNPFTGEETRASFWDLYDGALARAVPMAEEVLAPDFDLQEARLLTDGVDFEGRPHPEEAPVRPRAAHMRPAAAGRA